MPDLNKANRQVCDVDIRIFKTKEPFLFFDTANTTTAGITGDSVYAMAKGARRVAFQNPPEGTMTIEAQVVPFKMYALFSDGTIESTAIQAVKKTITATTAGSLTISDDSGDIESGTVFVYAADDFGGTAIEGTYTDGKFTATTASEIAVNSEYEVGYFVTRTSGVKKVSINTNKLPKDYWIQMSTIEKDEEGTLTPYLITAHKAAIQRNLDLSFSSEGDPGSVSITFDLLETEDGDFFDIVEDTDNAYQ
ncbi:MAG: hypothetical protein LUG91_00210 [Ruminococcus sp.]|nr:hypothetical protein [Ruminococcus sp.]